MNPIVCRQVARYVWKVYVRDDDGKVDIEQYRGQVQRVDESYYPLRAVYTHEYQVEPRLEPVDAQVYFRTLAEAAEAIT